jgi:hypothetical protein
MSKRHLTALLLALSTPLMAQQQPDASASLGSHARPPFHRSAPSLPLANGAITAVYDVSRGEIADFYTHPYKKYNAGEVTADLCMEANFGLQGFQAAPGSELTYLEGTGILHSQASDGTRTVDRYFFAPLPTAGDGYPDRLLVMLMKVQSVTPQRATAKLDFRVGEGGKPDPNDKSDDVDHQWRGSQGERIISDGKGWLETAPGQPHSMYYRPLGDWQASTGQGVLSLTSKLPSTGTGVWLALIIGQTEDHGADEEHSAREDPGPGKNHGADEEHSAREDPGPGKNHGANEDHRTNDHGANTNHGPNEDHSANEGREGNLGDLAKRRYEGGQGNQAHPRDQGLAGTVESYLAGRSPQALLQAEQQAWQRYHWDEPALNGISPERRAVYRQSTAFLKMGQVRERERPLSEGQILASVKDKWARAWARDGSYAIAGLARSGHWQEARAGLEFMLRTRKEPGHDYLALINETLPENRKLEDYLISVCRYWGDGSEESDINAAGPNIEYDDWGLFLWAFAKTLEAMPEAEREPFRRQHVQAVSRGVAEPLLRLIEPDGILAPDSSIWERHWALPLAYDGRRHHTYSSLAACNGLRRFAPWSEQPERYEQAAKRLQQGIMRQLRHPNGGLASSLEDLKSDPLHAYDAAVLEAVNWEVWPDASVVESLRPRLASLTPGSPGYCRNDDGTWYDSSEWLLLDLRAAAAWRKLGRQDRCDALLDWVTGWAGPNANTLGELLDQKGDFQGPFPMTGFGPGAYILAIDALLEKPDRLP